ncbi:MAG TPA: dynamin family protein [Actinomycetota bacterium]|nr:dynamin family protein [Actinomycetota bacterium]
MGETYAEAKQELEALLSALDQLRSENPGSALVHAVAAVRESLRSGRFTVVVAGEFKRGKTTFVNALLGSEILPAAVVPLTSVVTIVRWGEAPRAEVRLLDGRTEEVPVEDLASYVTERGNPANHRGVDRAVLEYPAESLRDGVILVDTPGVGSVYRHNTDAAYAFLPEADAAIFLTSADPPISETERGFLVAVREESARMFFVLNKADYLTERDLAEAVEFTADVLREAIGREVQLYPVSARRALEAKTAGSAEGAQASGFVEFERDFRDFLLHEKGLVILLSGARRLRKVVIDEVNSVDVEERALRIPEQEFARTIEDIEKAFSDVLVAREDVRTLLRRSADRLVEMVEADLADLRERATAEVLAECEGFVLDVEDPGSARQQAEETIRAGIRRHVDEWRRREERRVAERFRGESARFVEETNALIRRAVDVTASLLDIDLQVAAIPEGITTETRFSYWFFEELTWTEAMLPNVRRLLPGKMARRMLLNDVRERVPSLVDRQCGRIRWDFVQRLDRSRRDLERDLDSRLDATIGSLRSGLDRARQEREGAGRNVERTAEVLSARRAALQQPVAMLDRMTERFTAETVKERVS